MPKKPLNPAAELIRLEALCNRAEHCTHEIAEKLRRKGYSSMQVAEITASLRANRFIDDRRFATAYVHDKYTFSGWGRLKIKNGLRAKFISPDIIDEVMAEEIDPRGYLLTAFRAIRSRLRTLPADLPRLEARNKLMRFAASRGYEASVIIKILSSSRLWSSAESHDD